MECEFCGYDFPEELGRYGCPNCESEGLDEVPVFARLPTDDTEGGEP